MKKLLIATGFLAAATSGSMAQTYYGAPQAPGSRAHTPRYGLYDFAPGYGAYDMSPGFSGDNYDSTNAPGGAYIYANPLSPSAPVRLKPDGW